MLWKRLLTLFAISACLARFAFSAQCDGRPPKTANLDLWSTVSLPSPNHLWKFTSVGPNSSEKSAALYLENAQHSQRWNMGSIERDGIAFWSEDSERVFLRDESAADDTKIRVFDVSSSEPKEIKHLDSSIRKAIFARIPNNQTTLWLKYPRVCFAANDSSTIIVIADAPLVRKREGGPGMSFDLNVTVNLITLRIVNSIVGPSAAN